MPSADPFATWRLVFRLIVLCFQHLRNVERRANLQKFLEAPEALIPIKVLPDPRVKRGVAGLTHLGRMAVPDVKVSDGDAIIDEAAKPGGVIDQALVNVRSTLIAEMRKNFRSGCRLVASVVLGLEIKSLVVTGYDQASHSMVKKLHRFEPQTRFRVRASAKR